MHAHVCWLATSSRYTRVIDTSPDPTLPLHKSVPLFGHPSLKKKSLDTSLVSEYVCVCLHLSSLQCRRVQKVKEGDKKTRKERRVREQEKRESSFCGIRQIREKRWTETLVTNPNPSDWDGWNLMESRQDCDGWGKEHSRIFVVQCFVAQHCHWKEMKSLLSFVNYWWTAS